MYRIGIDVGGTKMNIGLFRTIENKLVVKEKIMIKDVNDPVTAIKNSILSLCDRAGVDFFMIKCCGMGIPGTVSEDGKKIIKAPNISILSEDIATSLELSLGIPVTLIQDSRAAAYGEYLAAGGKYGTLVCVTLGTGIGTGIVMNGNVYSGALGAAGELGHLPVIGGKRPCGCGKIGCLEKYVAGGGLDITAEEILGEGNNAHDLFDAARGGDSEAKSAISSAVAMLGTGLVSIVNLLSPDAILFSGGLSEQEDDYLNPLISFVSEHCYSAGKMPTLSKASLGEDAPLYGAAFYASEKKTPAIIPWERGAKISASIMCADVLNMGAALREIEEAGIEYLHCDIMDNHFVPNLMMPMDFLNKLRSATSLPMDFHLMTEKPETVIEKLIIQSGDIVAIHYESTPHVQRVLSLIKEKGARCAVAINPATPISVLEEVLPEIDMVLIMTVNPGFAGQKIVPTAFDKIRRARKYLDDNGHTDILIEVDGNCSFENVHKMYDAGADIFVVGTSSVFKKGLTVKEGTEKLRALIV